MLYKISNKSFTNVLANLEKLRSKNEMFYILEKILYSSSSMTVFFFRYRFYFCFFASWIRTTVALSMQI